MENVITLHYPIQSDEGETKTLSMRRPKVRDQLAADQQSSSDAERERNYFANLCEVSPDTIDELDLKDYKQLQDMYGRFLS